MKKLRLLIVEDEVPIRQGLTDVFTYHGYEVEVAENGEEGLKKALHGRYDLVILDVMLPLKDGFSVCDEIRQVDREQPIILLTAKTSEEDIITGLKLGADDYVAKPFSLQELLLRVEAVLRRSKKVREQRACIVLGDEIELDTNNLVGKYIGKRGAQSESEQIVFTRKEVELIEYLLRVEDRPVTRDELLSEVWGYGKAARIETRTVDIHIAKLRRKIERDPKNPQILLTVRGEGYKLKKGCE